MHCEPKTSHLVADIDECATGADSCDSAANEVCSNTVGSFTCICDSGYARDSADTCKGDYSILVQYAKLPPDVSLSYFHLAMHCSILLGIH